MQRSSVYSEAGASKVSENIIFCELMYLRKAYDTIDRHGV